MADLDIIIEKFERQHLLISNLILKVESLQKVVANQKEWITPEQAAEITNKSVKYLVDYKDTLGIVYSQNLKRGRILFKSSSVFEYLERKSNIKYL